MKVCSQPGCPTLTRSSRCPQHTREREQARGTAAARGYGTAHQRERARWLPRIAHGDVTCTRCGQPITRTDAWHLDHTDDRTAYRGPSHAHCNTSAGGRAAHS